MKDDLIQESYHPSMLLITLLFSLFLSVSILNNAHAEDNFEMITKSVIILNVGEKIEGEVAIYNTIKIPIKNLDKWSNQPGNDASRFILHIDGTAFPGLTPSLVNNNKSLQYDLKRTVASQDAWKTVLSRKPQKDKKEVFVTVSQNNVIVYGEAKASMIVVKLSTLKIFIGGSLLALISFWFLAIKSDVLRIPGRQPSGKGERKPYSLARTQMAFWFFAIIIAYVFIWMLTRDLSILTPTVLGLMGISAATGLGSAMMDSNKRAEKEVYRNEMEDEMMRSEVEETRMEAEVLRLSILRNEMPEAEVRALQSADDPLIRKKATLAAKQAEILQSRRAVHAQYNAARPRASVSFIKDILSDDKGISFHRVQMFGWTVVLITIFITSVSNLLAMPDFDTTLLGLMGISGATYLGFKLPNQEG